MATPPNLDHLVDTLNKVDTILSATMTMMAEKGKNLETVFDTIGERVKAMEDDAKKFADGVEGIKERVRAVNELFKDISKNMKTFRTAEDAEKHLSRVKKMAEDILASNKATVFEQIYFTRVVKEATDALKKLNQLERSQRDDLQKNAELVERMARGMEGVYNWAEKAGKSVKGFTVGPVLKSVMDINRMLGRSGRVEQFTRMAQDAYDTKQILKERQGINKEEFMQRKAALIKQFQTTGQTQFLTPEGDLDVKALSKSRIGRKQAASALSGPNAGVLDRALLNTGLKLGGLDLGEEGMLAKGGGSLLEAGGATAVEGAATGMEAFAGPIGVAVAAADMVRGVFDGVIKQNQEIEKKFGRSGIFLNKGVSPLQAFANIKKNMSAFGVNTLGITSERQFGIAQAMAESGVNVGQMATAGGLKGTGAGRVSDIVFKQARGLGMEDTESVKLSMKLLQQMHVTLASTQSFFQTIGRDTVASGIGMEKYVQIIDEITGKFDNMAKSLEDTTTLLRRLGEEGTNSAEMMKDATDFLVGGQKSLEQKAFLYTRMQQQGGMGALTGSLAFSARSAGRDVKQQLLDAMEEVLPAADDPEVKASRQGFVDRLNSLNFSSAEGVEAAVQAFGALRKTRAAGLSSSKIGMLEARALGAITLAQASRGNAVNFAAMSEFVEPGSPQALALQMAALGSGAQYAGLGGKKGDALGDLIAHPEKLAKGVSAAVLHMGGGTIGLTDQKKMFQGITAMGEASDSLVNQLFEGLHLTDQQKHERQGELNHLYDTVSDVAEQAGLMKTVKGETPEDRRQRLQKEVLSDRTKQNDLATAFRETSGKHLDILTGTLDKSSVENLSLLNDNKETMDEMVKRTEGVVANTRTTNDYLSGITDALKLKGAGLLGTLVDEFEKVNAGILNKIKGPTDINAPLSGSDWTKFGDLMLGTHGRGRAGGPGGDIEKLMAAREALKRKIAGQEAGLVTDFTAEGYQSSHDALDESKKQLAELNTTISEGTDAWNDASAAVQKYGQTGAVPTSVANRTMGKLAAVGDLAGSDAINSLLRDKSLTTPPKAPTVESGAVATSPAAEETGEKADEGKGAKTETPVGGGDEYNSYYGLNYQSVPTSNSMTYGNEGVPASLPGGR